MADKTLSVFHAPSCDRCFDSAFAYYDENFKRIPCPGCGSFPQVKGK